MSESGATESTGATGSDRTRAEVKELVRTLGETLSAAPPAADAEAAETFDAFQRKHAVLVRTVEILESAAGEDGEDEAVVSFGNALHENVRTNLAQVRAWSEAQAKR